VADYFVGCAGSNDGHKMLSSLKVTYTFSQQESYLRHSGLDLKVQRLEERLSVRKHPRNGASGFALLIGKHKKLMKRRSVVLPSGLASVGIFLEDLHLAKGHDPRWVLS